MKTLAVLYATREGHTRRIAEHVAATLRTREFIVDVLDVSRELPMGFDLTRYAGAVIAASVHVGKHERAMVEFVKARRTELERIPTAFLSVSLSEAGAEDANASTERRKRAAADVNGLIDVFLRETQWNPTHVHPVAGALLYRQYGVIVRLVMRFIAKQAGATTDTSRDHEYTDWQALDRFADELAADVEGPKQELRS
jgi:menaquinone-dependent protoporphyrinogen oxidase